MTRSRQRKRAHGFPRSPCPAANALELVGDKWSLLLVRDLLDGERTFTQLAASPEGVPTNILSDRLKRMQEAGLVEASEYQAHPPRYAYALTSKGRALEPVLDALVGWGKKHIPGSRTLEEIRAEAGKRARVRSRPR